MKCKCCKEVMIKRPLAGFVRDELDKRYNSSYTISCINKKCIGYGYILGYEKDSIRKRVKYGR